MIIQKHKDSGYNLGFANHLVLYKCVFHIPREKKKFSILDVQLHKVTERTPPSLLSNQLCPFKGHTFRDN